MQIGIVGLGRMGGNMARRLLRAGHEVVAYATDPAAVKQIASEGASGTTALGDLVTRLRAPRVAWVMVPAGDATEQVVTDLGARMQAGDTIIDGGNSFYKDDVRRMKMLREKMIHYVDAGAGGGGGGARGGVQRRDPIGKALAPGRGDIPRTPGRDKLGGTAEDGYLHCGPSGAGHFVKMVHNGIEYGLMQAYAEGLDIFHNANSEQ